jgi:hypothetical protein
MGNVFNIFCFAIFDLGFFAVSRDGLTKIYQIKVT